MAKRGVIILSVILFLLPSVLAQSPRAQGSLAFSIPPEKIFAGSNLVVNLTIQNDEEYAIPDAYLVFDIVEGSAYFSSVGDVIRQEVMVPGISLRKKSSKQMEVIIPVPNLPSGTYRLDGFLKGPRVLISGVPEISYPAVKVPLEVINSEAPADAIIDWRKTWACGLLYSNSFEITADGVATRRVSKGCHLGAVGPNVQGGSEVGLQVGINNRKTSSNGLIVNVSVYDWDDTQANSFVKGFRKQVDNLGPWDNATVNLSFIAPSKPGAYAIRIALLDSKNNILSVKKSRIVVEGESSHIQNLFIDTVYLKKNEDYKATVVYATPADSISELSQQGVVNIRILDPSKNVVFEKSNSVQMATNGGLLTETFSVRVDRDLKDFYLEAEVFSKKQLDFASIYYSQQKFGSEPAKLDVSLSGGLGKNVFVVNRPISAEFKVYDDYGEQVKTPVQVMRMDLDTEFPLATINDSGQFYFGRDGKHQLLFRSGQAELRVDAEFLNETSIEQKPTAKLIYPALGVLLPLLVVGLVYFLKVRRGSV